MASRQARDLNWLINAFAKRVPGVAYAAVVSTDGLLLAASDDVPPNGADQLAAVTAGLFSGASGAARVLDGDEVLQTVVEMGRGFLLVMSIQDGSVLAVRTSRDADLGVIGYEMARLVRQTGDLLTPGLRAELQRSLPS
jgi:predicted regulator of Ras-like GTPase activity (Roadblock/LC7/MglB family)